MKALRIVPFIKIFDTFKEFNDEFKIGKEDLIITNQWLYEPYMMPLGIDTNIIFQEKYGAGEPSDEMMDAMAEEMKKYKFNRIIAFGGGTIIDISKIFALEPPVKYIDLFEGTKEPVKIKELVLIPTTCGTGSEVTNVSVAELKSKHTKKGLQVDQLYGDYAVLIPETIRGLPYKFFITSSIDALIHAVEGCLAPTATEFVDLFALRAIRMIMEGYKEIIKHGEEERLNYLREFAIAATYAGVAFGNTGTAAVHAMSYSIGGAFHVPHGEANYQFFTETFKVYMKKNPNGKIQRINEIFAEILEVDKEGDIYGELEKFLGKLIHKKPLREYGMVESQIDEFTDSTIENQQRLLKNNYVFLDRDEIRSIFENLF
ncbi:4-hydroxybutyrate dehydrogenase [Clostridium aminobutyricum]|uniref:4-hydroxybutyrate dehydrogenase n=1 Tax=Clostridium aminobutyricum TaxID=33953 RepID=A0A939DA79_CLOAM|nr:4-hydroxybutyrate dehydrogenase [Clostridium aminobutyricum]MBN7773568.1 4-hydroxybutyrate dehydrogenase [Clostridium aminobutyricum]